MTLDPNLASWYRQPPAAPTLPVPGSVKMLRETLCVAQSRVMSDPHNPRRAEHAARLQRLIDACDRHRPLGPDGKHGDRHTPTCGCEDKPAGNYGPGQPRPRAVPYACPDQYASPHGAGSRPGGCATCAGVSDPATGSHPTSGSGVQPVGVGQPVGIRPAVPQPVVARQAVAGHCPDHPGPLDDATGHVCRLRPVPQCPVVGGGVCPGDSRGVLCLTSCATDDACPRCTSTEPGVRSVVSDGGGDASYCGDRWHDPMPGFPARNVDTILNPGQ